MQAFNLTRLNFHSPYKVWTDNGSYKFLTDYGVQYNPPILFLQTGWGIF